jgi:hypothetical protein
VVSNTQLKDVFGLRSQFKKIPFSDVVLQSSGHIVIPIDLTNQSDNQLIKSLVHALNNLLRVSKQTSQSFQGQRINDVGKNIENLIFEEVKKGSLSMTKLGSSGYPDFVIDQGGRMTYLEMKTTGNIHKDTTQHRMFYYSSGKKIKHDARHLLLQVQMEEESSKHWKIVSWQLRDFSALKVGLKTEFNANFKDFGNTILLASG